MARKPMVRQRNRLMTMRIVQEVAVDLIETRGFDDTTIEQIAEHSGVSASTIYRHFTTKENLVLWDEQDPVLDSELASRLGHQAPLRAFRDAAVSSLVERQDSDLFLRRLKLTYSVPSIWGAAARQDRLDRAELAAAIASVARRRRPIAADTVLAAVCLTILDVALEHWQASDGTQDLGELIDQTMAAATAVGRERTP